MTRIILCGCSGRMGHVVRSIVAEDERFEIVAGIDVFAGDADFRVFASAKECDAQADVIIDFSAPAALDGVLEMAVGRGIPAVLCATGYSDEQLEQIRKASEKVAILRSANMSLGVNTVIKLITEAARILGNNGYDIEIVEKHHNRKVDAPSGTALMLADAMQEALDGDYEYTYDRSQVRRARPKNEIGISSVRGGTIVGEHEVIFAGLDEVIEIRHTAFSRAVFGKGAVNAAGFLAGKPAGLYTMQDTI